MVHDHILQSGAAFRTPSALATRSIGLFSSGYRLVATMAGQTKVRSTSQQSEIYRETIMPYVMLKYAPPG